MANVDTDPETAAVRQDVETSPSALQDIEKVKFDSQNTSQSSGPATVAKVGVQPAHPIDDTEMPTWGFSPVSKQVVISCNQCGSASTVVHVQNGHSSTSTAVPEPKSALAKPTRPKVLLRKPSGFSNFSQGSESSADSVSSIMSQVRKLATSPTLRSRWGPSSGVHRKPQLKEVGFAQPSENGGGGGDDSSCSHPSDVGERSGPISPMLKRGVSSTSVSYAPRSSSGSIRSGEPDSPPGPGTGTAKTAKARWAKLRKQRGTLSQMEQGSEAAQEAVNQAIELSALATKLDEQYFSGGPHSPGRPNKVERLRRSQSNLSSKSENTVLSWKSAVHSVKGARTRSKSEIGTEVSAASAPPSPRGMFSEEAVASSYKDIVQAIAYSRPQRISSRYVAWLCLRTIAVLLSVGALLVQVFMWDHEFGQIFGCTSISLATFAVIIMATLSGPPSVLRYYSSEGGDGSGEVDSRESTIHTEIPALLKRAASGIASLQNQLEEVKLWDQLRDEQERLLRGFNRIITRETSLQKSRANVLMIIVQESEETCKEIEELCSALKVKSKSFSSLAQAEIALEEGTQSITSVASDNCILKGHPGGNCRDWRSHRFVDSSNDDPQRNQTRIVLLDTRCLPEELPLHDYWQDDRVLLAVTGEADQLNEAAKGLPKTANQSECREYWRAQGVSSTLQAPFTKGALRAVIMEAFHMWHREEYLLLDNIGHGTTGNVFRVKRLGDGNVLALKMMQVNNMQAKVQETMEREVNLLRAFRWPTVLFLLDAWVSGPVQCMLLPLLEGGDLAKVIKKKLRVPIDSILDWYAQTLHGLCYLHWRGVVHADIKPGNLLLATDGRLLLIGDLGSALPLQGGGPHPCKRNFVRQPHCTPAYAAPESLLQEKHFAVSDIWSVAATYFEAITLEPLLPPTSGDVKKQLEGLNFEDLTAGGEKNRGAAAVAALRNCKVAGNLVEDILEMWARDPQKRPSAANLLMRNAISERLKVALEETGALSITETTEHFKDLGQIIVDSEAASNLDPPAECLDPHLARGFSAVKKPRRFSATRFFSNSSQAPD